MNLDEYLIKIPGITQRSDRSNWKADFISREQKLKVHFPDADALLVGHVAIAPSPTEIMVRGVSRTRQLCPTYNWKMRIQCTGLLGYYGRSVSPSPEPPSHQFIQSFLSMFIFPSLPGLDWPTGAVHSVRQ